MRFEGTKWDLRASGGLPLKSSVRNANLALQEIGWAAKFGGDKRNSLSVCISSDLIDRIESQCGFRPTVKALREAVKQLRAGEFAPQNRRGVQTGAQGALERDKGAE